ncbi:MAG: IS1 family transposase [Cyanobacteria bacterium J06649_4]
MNCPFCDRTTIHKHGKTSKGSQRFRCAHCRKTFTETHNTLYYRRQVTPEQVETMLQARARGSSLRKIARTGDRAYGTVISVMKAVSNANDAVPEEPKLNK